MAGSEKISIGFHSYGTCTTSFAISLASAVRYSGQLIGNIIHIPSPYVTEARNKIVSSWLNGTKADYLLMVDADIQFPEDSIIQTYFAAKLVKAHIMFGNYALGDFRPSLFGAPPSEADSLPTVLDSLQAGQIYPIYAGATGWLLMTREAAETIAKNNSFRHWKWFDHDVESAGTAGPEYKNNDMWKEENNTIRIGEDFSFSKRARECGIQIWGTTIPLLIHEKYQPLLNDFQAEFAKSRGYGIKVSNQ